MNSMYEILMDLPLFQGVSRDKLSELIEKTPFHFLKYSNGQEIIAANSNCTHMKFIISGKVTIETQCRNLKIKLYENYAYADSRAFLVVSITVTISLINCISSTVLRVDCCCNRIFYC